jgi:hypothetical protein
VGQTEPEVLSFGLVKVAFGIVFEIFGYPKLLAVFFDDSIDTLALIVFDIIWLRGHRRRPLFTVGISIPSISMEYASTVENPAMA